MFAARAGAAKVIGVDCSDIIEQAKTIIAINGYSDIVTLVKGKMEEVGEEGCLSLSLLLFIIVHTGVA